eukprot:s9444_g1.t1
MEKGRRSVCLEHTSDSSGSSGAIAPPAYGALPAQAGSAETLGCLRPALVLRGRFWGRNDSDLLGSTWSGTTNQHLQVRHLNLHHLSGTVMLPSRLVIGEDACSHPEVSRESFRLPHQHRISPQVHVGTVTRLPGSTKTPASGIRVGTVSEDLRKMIDGRFAPMSGM